MSEIPTQAPSQGNIPHSILAVLASFVVVIILSIGTDAILHAIHFYPPLGEYTPGSILIWATIYRTIYGVIGSYVTARLAPRRPMKHALIGGLIGVALSTVGAAVTWNHIPPLGPHWYSVSLVIGALPTAWLGGKIRLMQTDSR